MRLRYVVEGEDSPAELEEEVCAEGDESPEGKERNNLLLDLLRQRDDLEEQGKVDGGQEHANADGLGSARHDGKLVVGAGSNEGRWSEQVFGRDA